MANNTIHKVLQDKTDDWMHIPGVVGVAIGEHEGTSCIRIFTSIDPKDLRNRIPSSVESFVVVLEKTGQFGSLG